MSTAFIELLRKSNLDYVISRKPFKIGSRSDDMIIACFVDIKTKKLQVNKNNEHPNLLKNSFYIFILSADRLSG